MLRQKRISIIMWDKWTSSIRLHMNKFDEIDKEIRNRLLREEGTIHPDRLEEEFSKAYLELKKQGHKMAHYYSQGREFDVAKTLALSIHHAEEVARRDKVNAITAKDRAQRVGIFVTSMRHFMPAGGIRDKLTQTSLWHDIGQPKEPCVAYLSLSPVTENILKTWLYEAYSLPVDLADIIDEELKELESSIPQLDVHVRQAKRLNDEAENVLSQLANIFVPE